ncbi:aldose 1-epimerase family protein [Arthrobacter sp. 2YAF22_2]|uniref:aldose 1-epimerase family protein n=1 Tax=Arthrobacter sp. 2YAF22_2 TaxID=3233029 RepID=UPI003F9286BE
MNRADYRIQADGYVAVFAARAGALGQLRHGDRDLVLPLPGGGPTPDFRGIIAAPWPNRIADGRYSFDGETHRLPVNDPLRGCALHGLSLREDWLPEAHAESSLVLSCNVGPVAGYPFAIRLRASYRLDGNGLHAEVTATNTGHRTAPYGICPHPYLLAGPAPLDEWTLEFQADIFLAAHPERRLPGEPQSVRGHEYDFHAPRVIGTTMIDNAFTGLGFDDGGRARLTVRDPGGSGVGMSWDRTLPWLQLYTGDSEPPAPHRAGLAVEPMSCPPDAFNSGQALVRLEPGEFHRTTWSIFAA